MDLPPDEKYVLFFEYFVDSLKSRPMTIEILAGEISHRNALTEILEERREEWGEEVSRALASVADYETHPELIPLTNILTAGVQHLLIRSRSTRYYGGIDIQSDEGWMAIKYSIKEMARKLLR